MADRGGAPGLSIGQLVTLTFGFLVASVLIFAFGWWVGYDLAQQRLAREQQVVRLPVAAPPTPPAAAAPAGSRSTRPGAAPAAPTATATPTEVSALPSPTRRAPTATRRVATATSPPTATRRIEPSTPTPRRATPTRAAERAEAVPPAGGGAEAERGWTVQAAATTDAVQAVVLARRLREKGYDAYTVTSQIQGVIWYRVRVGRFRDRTQAKVLEIRLKDQEGLTAAFVTPQ